MPSAAALVTKAFKDPEEIPTIKKIKNRCNISLNNVVEITEVMQPRSMAKDLDGIIKDICSMCVFIG